MLAVTLIAITLQIFFGGLVAGTATYSATAVGITSVSGLIAALSTAGGPALLIHASLGVLILLMGIGTTFIALRYHKRSVTVTTLLGLLSISLAVLGGYLWSSSDFTNVAALPLMGNAATGAYAFLFLSLYYTK
jgi:hypothetical protein